MAIPDPEWEPVQPPYTYGKLIRWGLIAGISLLVVLAGLIMLILAIVLRKEGFGVGGIIITLIPFLWLDHAYDNLKIIWSGLHGKAGNGPFSF